MNVPVEMVFTVDLFLEGSRRPATGRRDNS
jgi:hypothetical protein